MSNGSVFPIIVGTLLLTLLANADPASAQPLSPDRSAPCDAAVASFLPVNDSSTESAACVRRTYRLPATDTLTLRHDRYDGVEVTAWNESTFEIETVVVARRSTDEEAEADLRDIELLREAAGAASAQLTSTGPDGDAPGWWSVKYRLRVPVQTTLAITTNSGGIDVQGVVGAHTLRSDHGSINLALPPRTGVRLQAETGYGTINVGFPVTTQGAISERLEAVVSGGGPTMHLTSGSDITIRRVE